ncbi:unnamed protein product [Effrenium voratum]|nr:unnamed protein product [Effrenium voratum]
MKGRCQQGGSCGFCHRHHGSQSPRPPDRNRNPNPGPETIPSTPEQRLDLLLPFLAARALEEGLPEGGAELLEIIRQRLQELRQTPAPKPEDCPLQPGRLANLDKVLRRMTFSGLLGLALRNKLDRAFTERLKVAFQELRQEHAARSTP